MVQENVMHDLPEWLEEFNDNSADGENSTVGGSTSEQLTRAASSRNSIMRDHSIFFQEEESNESTCSYPKTQNLQIGELMKQLDTLALVTVQRGIPVPGDGALGLLEM